MTYFTPYRARRNAFDLSASLGGLESQLDALFAGIPSFSASAAPGSAFASDPAATLRWYEKPDSYRVRIDLPGVAKEQIGLELEDGTLHVSAQRVFAAAGQDEEGEEPRIYRKSFRLPEDVQEDAIAASLENGVLSLTLPKSEKAKPRQIRIN